MTAYELRHHLRDAHGLPTRGLDMGQLEVLHWDCHLTGADHEHHHHADGERAR